MEHTGGLRGELGGTASQRPAVISGKQEDADCALRGCTGLQSTRAVRGSQTCAWNTRLSHVKAAVGVTVEAKLTSAVEFYWHFHDGPYRDLFLVFEVL